MSRGIGAYLVEAHLREGRSVGELARAHGVHRSWLYKLLARWRREGPAGLEARSRRPRRNPAAMSQDIVDRIAAVRRDLLAQGADAGAATIHWHLERDLERAPSPSSVHRALRRLGLVRAQPRKRPRSSFRRFEASLPNELWQSDMTHWQLSGGQEVEIVDVIDDHSRLCIAAVAMPVATALEVMRTFLAAQARYGSPAALLTDNGAIYSGQSRGGKVLLETTLARLGIVHKRSRPYHPQTLGKVERFHQTLKRHLAARPAETLEELQEVLDAFALHYNERRPHRALGRRTPREAYDARIKATPAEARAVEAQHFRIRRDRVDRFGKLTLRYGSELRHIGMGRRLAGREVVLLVADSDVRVLSPEGEVLRHLVIDPTRNYQPQTMSGEAAG